MSRLLGHPPEHGHNQNPEACGSGNHRGCTGFSGGYDTYTCGCCCHDPADELSDYDRLIVARMMERPPDG